MVEKISTQKRNNNIDLIKIVSCVAVVGLHTFMPNALSLYYLCGFAVPMFFMVNGYFILNKFKIAGGGVLQKENIFAYTYCYFVEYFTLYSIVIRSFFTEKCV